MGIFGSLFGTSDETISKGIDLINRGADGLDALWFTDEERTKADATRAELKFKFAELGHEFVKDTLDENSIRSYTRRVLAWAVMGMGIFITLYGLVLQTIAILMSKPSAKEISAYALSLLKVWWPVIFAISAFYFGVHMIRAAQKTKKSSA